MIKMASNGMASDIQKTISIVVPVYFNAGSLPLLFEALLDLEKRLLKKFIQVELIFVDDGSRDNSLDLLLQFKEGRQETKVVKLTRNFGAIHCSKTGLQFVTGDVFTMLAADLQDPPSLILDMVDRWLGGAKFVVCERVSRADPFLSKMFSSMYYSLLRVLVMPGYPNGGFDMMLLDSSLLKYLTNSSKSMFTPLLAYWLGYQPEIISYDRMERRFGKSKWTFAKKIKSFLDIILGFSITPLRAISGFGLITALLSFGYGSTVVISAFFYRMPVEGFATIVALITFLLGLIIIMLGIIGEYIWRIFEESNKRPETVIEKVW
jgi:glycosyltransferase involved in cell wall biosynthesis